MIRPRVITTVPEIRQAVRELRTESGTRIGLVPTMGALHEGHLSLVKAAREDNEAVVVSIFVNPLQFSPDEDLDSYPRTLDDDLDLLATEGIELVFHPDAGTFTDAEARTTVRVDGLTSGLEASSRPTHFDGVTTIVAKLLNTVGPDTAYFGAKDFQQQAIIHRMVADLNMPVQIVTCPLVREPDGLALSSRNRFLSADERRDALALSSALELTKQSWVNGQRDATVLGSALTALLDAAPGVRLDYAQIIDPVTLEPLGGTQSGDVQAVVAAFVGATRLIDTARIS